MRISKLVLRNFQCYRGEHVLNLEAKAYAIVARKVDDSERSNWLGKSTILEAIFFVLYGEHRHRLEDDWITNGEQSGGVVLTFDTGEVVSRGRNRGERTTLVFVDTHGKEHFKDSAITELKAFLGVSRNDFVSSCYFQQKQMSRFIHATPSERTDLVSSWFGLDKLGKCFDLMVEDFHVLARKCKEQKAKIDSFEMALSSKFGGATKEEFVQSLVDRRHALTRCMEDKERLKVYLKDFGETLERVERTNEFSRIVQKGKEVAKALEEAKQGKDLDHWKRYQSELFRLAHEDKATSENLKRKVLEVSRIAAGDDFSGKCPVIEGFDCPAKKEIQQRIGDSKFQLNQMYDDLTVAIQGATESSSLLSSVERRLVLIESLDVELNALRAKAKAVKAKGIYETLPDLHTVEEAREKLEQAIADESRIASEILHAENEITAHSLMEKGMAEHQATFKELNEQLQTIRIARKLFSPHEGLFKQFAETPLAYVEHTANQMLKQCGIDLSVQLTWQHEGQGMATHCDACGAPFPTSTKVKACDACGEERGKKVVNKLQVELSDRSGAADDIAGVVIQLAASEYLRTYKGVSFGAVMLDEPFGSLDQANRKAFAGHLAQLLGTNGTFAQSFTIAHHDSILDALPGRIEILSDGKNSWVRLVT